MTNNYEHIPLCKTCIVDSRESGANIDLAYLAKFGTCEGCGAEAGDPKNPVVFVNWFDA